MRDVRNAVARFFRAVDERNWDGLRAAMAPSVLLDYASFGGGPAGDREAEAIVGAWSAFLPGFEHTHHQLGNLEVEVGEGGAKVRCYGTATHVLEADVWTVVGTYDVDLRVRAGGWVVSGLRFGFKYQAGALDLPERARARLA